MTAPRNQDVCCSLCGRTLRGAIDFRWKFHVRKHKRPDGSPCLGYWKSDHKPVEVST